MQKNLHQSLRKSSKMQFSDKHYIVKNSVGNGNWANCPWIAIFDPLITKTAQEGYYLLIL